MENENPSPEDIEVKYSNVLVQAIKGGYHLNPDREFVDELIRGLVVNKGRYGFEACPCRLVIGSEEENRDIICPCYYRDDDITDYGCCYCGLYVSRDVSKGRKPVVPIPERRDMKSVMGDAGDSPASADCRLSYPIHRCRVCGYLCARNSPPDKCPVCGADQNRFELFMR
jgi:ferredoxin-thioredoxin reductase catalytic subunit